MGSWFKIKTNGLLHTLQTHEYGGSTQVFDSELQYAVVRETWCEIRASLPETSTDRGTRGAIIAQGLGLNRQITVA